MGNQDLCAGVPHPMIWKTSGTRHDGVDIDDQFKDPDTTPISEIHALCALLRIRRPSRLQDFLSTEEVNRWRSIIVPHVEKYKNKIPAEFRDGFLKAVTDDFDFLQRVLDLVE